VSQNRPIDKLTEPGLPYLNQEAGHSSFSW